MVIAMGSLDTVMINLLHPAARPLRSVSVREIKSTDNMMAIPMALYL